MKRFLLIALLVAVIIFSEAAATSCSTLSARIQSDRVHIKISSNLTQNITSLFERKIVAFGDSLTYATRAFEKQIQAKLPKASVRNLSVVSVFTNNTIENAIEFDVFETVTRRGEVVTANLTWRSFDVLDDLQSENVHYNLVGKTYFRMAVDPYENMTQTQFYENRTLPATIYKARDIAGNITMLRFKSLGRPLSNWEEIYDVAKAETSYRLKVGQVIDLAARRELNVSTSEFGIRMDFSGEITTSGLATVRGEAIVSEFYTGVVDVLMFTLIGIPLFLVITAHLIEKKKMRMKSESRRR